MCSYDPNNPNHWQGSGSVFDATSIWFLKAIMVNQIGLIEKTDMFVDLISKLKSVNIISNMLVCGWWGHHTSTSTGARDTQLMCKRHYA